MAVVAPPLGRHRLEAKAAEIAGRDEAAVGDHAGEPWLVRPGDDLPDRRVHAVGAYHRVEAGLRAVFERHPDTVRLGVDSYCAHAYLRLPCGRRKQIMKV